ncbi:BsuBI/PstI family type II restriction endonuclease [Sphingomicrobium sp. XHP0239]|uniref:BsuBI/PstI family type II restriction endonuclease n=1 Tax=Sphingomicrobium maritimum TaxID=3133972 RepID=UPI0031CC8681
MQADGRGVPDEHQGVSKDKIRQVLAQIDLHGNNDLVDAVFALLDNETSSWFSKAPKGSTIADGASTAHLACHIGILQRGALKLDREGRDYWIKPLRDLGGIEAVTLKDGEFVPGHTKAKSPNSSYRLEEAFQEILTAPHGEWQEKLEAWSAQDAARERLAFQAKMAEAAKKASDTGHAALINDCVEHYAPRFLEGYEVLYVDDSDGDRISDEERAKMQAAGAELTLADPMPDILLWHPETDWLWVIEAVTSDGEVDAHKVRGMQAFAQRCGKAGVGFTTAYRTWRETAARQGKQRNIAVETYIWIREDPSKQLLLKA